MTVIVKYINNRVACLVYCDFYKYVFVSRKWSNNWLIAFCIQSRIFNVFITIKCLHLQERNQCEELLPISWHKNGSIYADDMKT